MMHGRLIVLEGIDGSGKSTQYRLLRERLMREGVGFRAVSFPRYDRDSSALVRAYLAGEFGGVPGDVNPYAASAFYTVDRFASYRTDWGGYYGRGGLVLCDRYTTSNACHQGAKLSGAARDAFLDWLADFEYVRMGLPEPDRVFYLDIDLDAARGRVALRDGEADIHERDRTYLAACLEAGRYAAAHFGWHMVNGGRAVEDVHAELYAAVLEALAES